MERRRGRTEEIRCEPRRNNNVLVGLGQVSEGLAAKRGVRGTLFYAKRTQPRLSLDFRV